MKKVLVIGANGTIGSALCSKFENPALAGEYEVTKLSRQQTDYSEKSLQACSEQLDDGVPYSIIVCCVGVLHNDIVQPEKRLEQLNAEALAEYFRVNTIIPALCLRFFSRLLDRNSPSKFVFLSAMVGSIADNALGGWYGYRSSKAALNMMVKTASIEVARTNKQACLAVMHPGTTQSSLSRPYSGQVKSDKYYTPEQSAQRIIEVVEQLTPEQNGNFFNWDGTQIAW